jgi:hypothetical protein
MSSLRRVQSSKANGAFSKGPVTPAGKQRSSPNSLRHGLCAKCIVLDYESRENFLVLLQQHIALQPAGAGPERMYQTCINAPSAPSPSFEQSRFQTTPVPFPNTRSPQNACPVGQASWPVVPGRCAHIPSSRIPVQPQQQAIPKTSHARAFSSAPRRLCVEKQQAVPKTFHARAAGFAAPSRARPPAMRAPPHISSPCVPRNASPECAKIHHLGS